MFTLAQWIARLTKGFIKFTGKKPDKLAKLKIKFEALQKVKDQQKVVDLRGNILDPSKPIVGGTQSEFTSGIMKSIKSKPTVIETEAELKLKLDKLLGPGDDVFGSPIKDWHMEKFKKPGAKDVTPKETAAQIKSRLEGMNKKTVDRIRRRRYEAALKEERRKLAEDPNYIRKIIDPEDFAGGGIAGMLGEPTYAGGGRVPLWKGSITESAPRQERIQVSEMVKAFEERQARRNIQEAMKNAPEGVLMDPPPDKKQLRKLKKRMEEQVNPRWPDRDVTKEIRTFPDGTMYDPKTDKYYVWDDKNDEPIEVHGPEVKEGGRIGFKKGNGAMGSAGDYDEWRKAIKDGVISPGTSFWYFLELKETGGLPGTNKAEGGRIGYSDGTILPEPKPEEVYLDKRLEKLQRAKKTILESPDAFTDKGEALIKSINNDIAQLRKEYVAIEKIPGHATGGVSNLFRRR